jgi:transposase-like protein
MVAADLRSALTQQSREAAQEEWEQVSVMLAAKSTRTTELIAKISRYA